MIEKDVMIIGAGPSGTVAAARLNQLGIDAIVVEKSTFPRFVIGESLLPRCMKVLQSVNLIDTIKSVGFQVKKGAMFSRDEEVCEFDFSEKHSTGWDWTWQVPRDEFDQVIADEVRSRGVLFMYESEVEQVQFMENCVLSTIKTSEGTEVIKSKYIIDGSGFGRVIPKLLKLEKSSDLPSRGALFAHFKDENRSSEYATRIQIIVLSGTIWTWIIPFSNGITSIGIVGDLEERTDSRTYFDELIQTNQYLKKNYSNLDFKLQPRRMNGYSIGVSKFYGDRFVLTGNSTEFLDPIFSSGVTFAIESGFLAAELVAKEINGEEVKWEEEYVAPIQKGLAIFKRLIESWYDGDMQKIIFSKDFDPKIKKMICSILAGYVWDDTNPLVKSRNNKLKTLAKVIEIVEARS